MWCCPVHLTLVVPFKEGTVPGLREQEGLCTLQKQTRENSACGVSHAQMWLRSVHRTPHVADLFMNCAISQTVAHNCSPHLMLIVCNTLPQYKAVAHRTSPPLHLLQECSICRFTCVQMQHEHGRQLILWGCTYTTCIRTKC